jgi:hypothetical protein
MTPVKIVYIGFTLSGRINQQHPDSNNSFTTVTTIEIDKAADSINLFKDWPRSQGVYFKHAPYGSGDYFLIYETPSMYIFQSR